MDLHVRLQADQGEWINVVINTIVHTISSQIQK